ncbi:Dna polymerase i protein [Thalictrum thalictroides]|uniref:Dna polymerase i protein n=1 Tax=Thalictrum thalictroides TaxID=46969 RepID=A0A7J6WZA9_THATH|nr:Dna polymerase i protein [Thalictrum thalictroides]
MEATMYTATGWPSVSGEALKTLAGKVSSDYDWLDDAHGFESDVSTDRIRDLDCSANPEADVDVSLYGTAYKAFGGNKEGKEACHAITALCDICSIGSLISNFILPLQSNHISGKNGRVHCSLNINTETGRLSARRPNLQIGCLACA